MDFAKLAEALEQARLTGDRTAVRAALEQLETDELPAEPGEVRRFHIRGAPPEQCSIVYAPAEEPPPSYPSDLPWIPGTNVGISHHGEGMLAVHWFGVDAARVLERILEHSRAAGWVEPPGPRFGTASGAQVRHLDRPGFRRTINAMAVGEQGMIQLVQFRSPEPREVKPEPTG